MCVDRYEITFSVVSAGFTWASQKCQMILGKISSMQKNQSFPIG
jgi:hypothetical protein